MIKKYITLAALLSAGTALANAATGYQGKNWEVVGNPVKITTTFSNTSGKTSIGDITPTVTVTGAGGYGGSITDKSTSPGLNGAAEPAVKWNIIVPNINVAEGGEWTLNFNYNLSQLNTYVINNFTIPTQTNHRLRIDSVDLKLGAVDSEGYFVLPSENNNYHLRVSIQSGSGAATTKGLDKNVTATGESATRHGTGTQDNPISFTLEESQTQSLTPTADTKFTLFVKGITGSDPGSIGIESITFNASVVKEVQNVTPTPGSPNVPEPSAFGLLAGLGALALVASRRRRK